MLAVTEEQAPGTGGLAARARQTARAFAAASRNPALRRLQSAHVLADTGGWAGQTAIGVYAFTVGGATLVGLTAFAWILPGLVVGPLLGTLADRHSRVRVLSLSALGRAVVQLTIALTVLADAPAELVLVLPVVSVSLVSGYFPAKAALLPALARTPEELTAANVVSSAIESTSIFVGPAVAGLLLAVSGVEAAVGFAGAATLIAGLVASTIPEPAREAPEQAPATEEGEPVKQGLVADARAGFALVAGDSRLRTLVGLIALQVGVGGALNVLSIALAIDVLHTGQSGVGALNSALGVGAFIGAILAAGLAGSRRLAPPFLVGLVLWGLPLVVVGLATHTGVALAMLALLGFGNTLLDVAGFTLIQRAADERVLGRVFGVFETASIVTYASGLLLAPALIAIIDVEATLVVVGCLLPVLALLSVRAVVAADVPGPAAEVVLLRRVPMLAALPAPMLDRLAAGAQRVTVAAGETVVREGDEADRFYVIDAGRVEVDEGAIHVRTQSAGDCFGEIGLLHGSPRTATVKAGEPTTLLAIDGTLFRDAMDASPAAGALGRSLAAGRLGSALRAS